MVGVEPGVIKLKLSRASERNGPLSHYLLCVVQESKATKPPNDFTINDVSVTLTNTALFTVRMPNFSDKCSGLPVLVVFDEI